MKKMRMKSWESTRSIFMHADGVDWMLMGLGFIGSIGDGCITPTVFLIIGLILNDLGVTELFDENVDILRQLHGVFHHAWRLTIVGLPFARPPFDPWTDVRTSPHQRLEGKYVKSTMRLVLLPSKLSHW
ncbi:unnamed protein product [Microthlaspi erraticum]|uniref:Uncharacterized protein n=1 Tax=Microthlaspi erraticum TaxID=1685480 RepID=A0A6D2KFU1_9BRAS|nr:unnamed protein product [Microthlaspi erraticum]